MCICAAAVWGQVGVISVTDENKHAVKEDFYHTFELFIWPDGGASPSKCQATRIHKRWFVTAAHCVYKKCDKGCRIELDLLEQLFSAWALGSHAPKAKSRRLSVFIHPEYTPGTVAKNDIALIKLDLQSAPKMFYRRAAEPGSAHQIVPEKMFLQFLGTHKKAASQYAHVLRPQLPPLLAVGEMNYLLDRKISVISIFDGVREIKQNPHKTYYVKKLGFAYTPDFGVRKGMSGSGVMTNTGELAGIISSSFIFHQPVTYTGDRRARPSKVNNFFLFTAFNKNLLGFMQDTMGSDYYQLDIKDAPSSWKDSSANHQLIVNTVGEHQRAGG